MLRLTIKFFPKPQFPFAILFRRPSTSAAALGVAHNEPSSSASNPYTSSPPSLTKNEAVSKLLLCLFSTRSTNGTSIKKLRGEPRLRALLSGVNASEMESIVELLRRKKPQLALDFFFLSKNEYGFKHSKSAHLIVAHVLAAKQRLRDLKFHLLEVVKEEGSGSAPAICELLQNNFVNWVSCNTVWNMLAFSYSRVEMVFDALFVLSKMKDLNLQVSIRAYNSLLHNLRHTDTIWDVYNEIKACGVSQSEYTNSIIIDGLCRQSLVHEAVAFLQETREGEPGTSVACFNSIMSAFCKMDRVDVATSFFCMMFKCGLLPDVYSYNILIHGLCIAGSMEEALELASNMEKHGLEPDLVTYNILAKGFNLLGMMSLTLKIISQMLQRDIHPDIVTHKILFSGLHSLCKSGHLNDALNLFHQMEAVGLTPDIVMYSILIHGLCKQGHVHRAVQLYKKMCSKRIVPNSFAHRSILLDLCENGSTKEARTFFDGLTNNDLMGDIVLYNIMINKYVKLGDIREAVRLYKCILERGITPSTVTYTTLMNAFCEEGNTKAFLEMLSEMEARDIEPTFVTYTVIIKYLCKLGRLLESVKILKDMFAKGLSPDELSFNTVIQGFSQAGDMKMAFCLYNEMLRHNLQPCHVTYNILINGLCVFWDLRVADLFFSSLQDQNMILSKKAYTTLIKAHSAKGDAQKAMSLFQQMVEKRFEVTIRDYSAVVNRLCKRCLIHDAVRFIRMMLSSGITVDKRMCSVMLDTSHHGNDHDSICQLFIECGLDQG